MSNKAKKVVSIIGIIVGVIIIVVGFSLQDTSNYPIGKSIKFGADFYTEMYDVTKDVGHAINYAINDLIRAIGWLIISLGAIDVCFFVYKLIKACCEKDDSNNSHSTSIEKHNIEQSSYENYNETKPGTDGAKVNLKKFTQCECGELYYGLYCPVCGKSSKTQSTPQPSSVHIAETSPDEMTKNSHVCKCGERFYGKTCPNCGRNLKDCVEK